MSVQDRPVSPAKPELKPKPEAPPRTLLGNSISPVGGGSGSGSAHGKVKKMAQRFTKEDSTEAGEQLVNGSAELSAGKQVKKPPEVKPKPDSISVLPQVGAEQAPPLPKKRSRFLKQKSGSTGEESEAMDRRRSAPDGKEVEVQGTAAAEAKPEDTLYSTVSRCCSKTCTCMCHLKRPGMMLIWVPVDEQENGGPGDGVGQKDEDRLEGQTAGGKVGEKKAENDFMRRGEQKTLMNEVKVEEAENEVEKKDPETKKEVHRKEKDVEQLRAELEAQAAAIKGEQKEAEKNVPGEETKAEQQKVENDPSVPTTETKVDYRAEDGRVSGENKEGERGVEEKDGAQVEDEKMPKLQFCQSLEMLLAGGPRRPSEQSPQAAPTRCQNAFPKNPVPSQTQEEEEEGIYELYLPGASKSAEKVSSARTDFPDSSPRSFHKTARREKPPPSTSDSTPEFESTTEPPAVPPRVPLNGAAVPRVENSSGRTSAGSSLLPDRIKPQPPKTSPPSSPLVPVRPPPAPPKTDSRRSSIASNQSNISSGDETITNEEKKDRERSPVRRKFSFKWEFQLRDEPLYQTYNESAIKKELRRQNVIRNISRTSTDYAMQLVGNFRDGKPAKPNLSRQPSLVPAVSKSTLWQDLPAVRDSGLLDQLTPEQIKYQESMFEVLTSETSYLRSLCVLIEHFMENRELTETIIISEKKTLFSNILKVREVSERFLKDLQDHIFNDTIFPDICDIIHYHAQHHFSTYIVYIRNQAYQEKVYSRLMKTNEQFATVINRLQELPHCQRLPFISFLLLPFQRITRIKMLIENILKRTKEGTPEEQTASRALDSVSKIIDQCNKDVGKMKQMEELIEISKMLDFERLKAIPVISETRFLEKKGELQEMSKSKTFVNMRAKFSPVYLFLFNDQLLITIKKSSDRYVVVDYTHRSLVQAQPLDECFGGVAYENCFNLVMLENHQGRMMERVLKAPSKSDMQRWLAAFPNATKDDLDEEVIYEDWDCPQVQCVEQYIAQQADELSLEPTEIVNVIRKTNEGWYEGIRLSDGQKGWFPDANVIEITNEHVRRRNIKERYRVSQATRMLKNVKAR